MNSYPAILAWDCGGYEKLSVVHPIQFRMKTDQPLEGELKLN